MTALEGKCLIQGAGAPPIVAHTPPTAMSGQGRSTASPRSRHLSPRLTVSARSQSQRSAHTIYSDVESDHNVFAFVPPPAADAQVEDLDLPPAPALPPTEGDPLPTANFRLPTSDLNRRRPDLPSFGQFARRPTTGFESSGPGTADSRVVIQEDGSGSMGGGSGSMPGSSGSDGGGGVTSRPRTYKRFGRIQLCRARGGRLTSDLPGARIR